MKLLSLLIMALVFSLSLYSASASIKVGVIDVDKVLVTIDEGKGAQKKLEDEAKKLEAQYVKVQKDYEEMIEKYKKQSAVLSDSGKKTQEENIRKKEMELMNEQRESRMKMEKLKQELQNPLVDKIQKIANEVADGKGIEISFIKGFTAPFTAKNQEEITDEVISAYNKKYPSK